MNTTLTVTRLTSITPVVKHWVFFRDGIVYESKYLRYDYPLDVYRRILFSLVRSPTHAWVAIATNDQTGDPVAFLLSHDTTPLHAPEREFEVSMFYYAPGFKTAITLLQTHLDSFCRGAGVRHYSISTTSSSRSAERALGAWTGLQHSNTVFKRILAPAQPNNGLQRTTVHASAT